MMGRKYRLLRAEIITDPFDSFKQLKVYRIKALRDIPEHFVHRGEIGGYVTDKMTLSHEGGCWVGGNAIVHGATVTGNAFISGNAVVYAGVKSTSETLKSLSRLMDMGIRDKPSAFARITIEDDVVIRDYARLTAFEADTSYINPVKIRGNAYIDGAARLNSPALVKNAAISGNVTIGLGAKILDSAQILDNAKIGKNVTVGGTSKIAGYASVGSNSMVFGNIHLAGHVKVAEYTKVTNEDNLFIADDFLIEPGNKRVNATQTTGNAEKDTINRMLLQVKNWNRPEIKRAIAARSGQYPIPTEPVPRETHSAKMAKYKRLLQETLDSLNSYETDIVKIIKYPVMVDRTDDYTASMLSAKRAVSLVDPETEESEFYAAVLAFDKAFHAAEAHALKTSNSLMNPEEKKKTQKAHDLFSIAMNKASSENEKVNAFKQGFKQLEGIILVPEQAVMALRAKAGIAELEV